MLLMMASSSASLNSPPGRATKLKMYMVALVLQAYTSSSAVPPSTGALQWMRAKAPSAVYRTLLSTTVPTVKVVRKPSSSASMSTLSVRMSIRGVPSATVRVRRDSSMASSVA